MCFYLAACACARTTWSEQRALNLTPVVLQPTPTGSAVRTAKVRIYADEAYRGQTVNWERRLSLIVQRANAVLGPTTGLELEIAETKNWTRQAASTDLDGMLEELEELDPGGNVTFVVGVVDALPEVSSALHALGLARPLGKHLIVRGLNDTKEVAVLNDVLRDLDDENREKLYSVRRRHKETLIFLHEIAHLLGGIHVTEQRAILHPIYDSGQYRFTMANARLMRIAAAFRTKANSAGDRTAELEAIRAYLAATPYPKWNKAERKELEDQIEYRLATKAATKTELAAISGGVRPADRQTYRAAVELADGNRALEAWEKAEALFDFYPKEPAIQLLACRLAAALKRSDTETRCRTAAGVAPGDVTPTLTIAIQASRSGKTAEAIAALGAARDRLLELDGDYEEAWADLATAYRRLGLVGLAGDCAARTEKAEEVRTWAARTSARYGVPPLDSRLRKKLPPEADADYVTEVKKILRLTYDRKFAEAEKSAAAARRRFGPMSGFATALCDLEIRRHNYARAMTLCRGALSRFEPGSWNNYLLGLLHQRAKKRRPAIKHLVRAIELDGELRHAYSVLAKLYKEANRTAELDQLRDAYRKRFNSALQ